MKYRSINILFLIVLWMGNTAMAQQKWSLNNCIAYAIENNTHLKQFEIQEKIYEEILNQSKRNLLPSLGASTNAGLNFGRSVDPNTNDIVNTEFFNNTYNIESSIVIFDGFRLTNRIQYEKFRKKASEYNRLNAIDDLAFTVMNSYFDVIYYMGMLEITKQQVETSKLNLKATERQVTLGLLAQADLLEMSANMEMEELRFIQVDNSLKSALLKLRQNMNFTDHTALELTKENAPLINKDIPSCDELFGSYTEWSPFYQSFVSQLKVSEKSLSISRSGLYPSLNAQASINTGFYETYKDNAGNVIDFNDQFKNNKSQYLGASLRIPVFELWANRSNIKQAKLEVERSKARLESEAQKLYFEMSQNLNDIEAIGKEYIQYKKQLELDKLAFQTAERKLEQGLISVIDFYQVKNRYANTNSQLLRVGLQQEIKRKTLDFYTGMRFWE